MSTHGRLRIAGELVVRTIAIALVWYVVRGLDILAVGRRYRQESWKDHGYLS